MEEKRPLLDAETYVKRAESYHIDDLFKDMGADEINENGFFSKREYATTTDVFIDITPKMVDMILKVHSALPARDDGSGNYDKNEKVKLVKRLLDETPNGEELTFGKKIVAWGLILEYAVLTDAYRKRPASQFDDAKFASFVRGLE